MTDYQQKIYQEKISTNNSLAKTLEKKRNVVSVIRVLVFISTLIAVVYWANDKNSTWMFISLVIGTVLFLIFLKRSTQLNALLSYHRLLASVNEEELARDTTEWKGATRGSFDKAPSDHPYAYDLDIFGNKSVFALLNRTSSELGKDRLANWLLSKALKEEILLRQEAVKELNPLLEWRQNFQVQGLIDALEGQALAPLLKWIKQADAQFLSKKMRILSIVLPGIALLFIVLCFATSLPASLIIIGLLGNFWMLQRTAKAIGQAVENTDNSVNSLKSYARMMKAFEEESFQTEKLKALQTILTKDHAGSAAIARLSTILYNLERRKNPYFYVLVNVVSLYDVQWMIQLEQWKQKYAAHVEEWLAVIAQVDALQSIAGFAYNEETYTYPEVSEDAYTLKAKQIGHPLIAKGRVCNDFELVGKGKTAIITGSNMSGKSTFERTLGVNMVLAYTGAPVCAEVLTLSLLQVFTCMRVQDSLDENVSGFYAELRRIQQLLENIQEGTHAVFYFLDEILKGTNSKDRTNGARALIKQLSGTNSLGLITTHDLELGELADQFPELVSNFSFNSSIQDGKLLFDYQISSGVCYSFSATKLMQGIGILIEDA